MTSTIQKSLLISSVKNNTLNYIFNCFIKIIIEVTNMDKFLTPEEFNIDNIFHGKYIIPIYQRPYSWGKQEVIQFMNDIK